MTTMKPYKVIIEQYEVDVRSTEISANSKQAIEEMIVDLGKVFLTGIGSIRIEEIEED